MEKTVKIHDGREVPAAKLLAALYNGTEPVGLGMLRAMSAPIEMTEAKAQEALDERGVFSFDYLGGRPLKVRAKDNVIDERSVYLYDRDAGDGAFERAVLKALV